MSYQRVVAGETSHSGGVPLRRRARLSALLGGLDERPQAERKVLWLNFVEPQARTVMLDWPTEAVHLVGQLRAHLAQRPNDPRGAELVAQLEARA